MNQYVTGAMIKRLREKNKLTQLQLAEAVGVSDKAVSKWETGAGYPDITLLEPIAGALRVSVADISGKRLQSTEESIPVGEYYHSEFGDLFSCDDERVFTSLTGIPPGLTWNPSWDLLYGTPTKAGVYILTATAEFPDGSSETATSRLFVNAPGPGVYGVNVEELDGLAVGDVLEPGDLELGTYEGGEGVTYVKGLPGGLEVRTWAGEDGAVHYEVVGIVRSAGLFVVSVGVACGDGTVVDTEQEVIVYLYLIHSVVI